MRYALPQVELNTQESNEDTEYQTNLKAAQTELGCLLWIDLISCQL